MYLGLNKDHKTENDKPFKTPVGTVFQKEPDGTEQHKVGTIGEIHIESKF